MVMINNLFKLSKVKFKSVTGNDILLLVQEASFLFEKGWFGSCPFFKIIDKLRERIVATLVGY